MQCTCAFGSELVDACVCVCVCAGQVHGLVVPIHVQVLVTYAPPLHDGKVHSMNLHCNEKAGTTVKTRGTMGIGYEVASRQHTASAVHTASCT